MRLAHSGTLATDALGTAAEAWFIHDGHLYQIAMTTPGSLKHILNP
jgi:hypothetical protein